MEPQLRLMCVLAHPDDAAMTLGGLLARYAAEGVGTSLVIATRGEREWSGDRDSYPGPEAVGRLREAELGRAAAELGLRDVTLLDERERELDQAEPTAIVARIAGQLRRTRPQVVVTADPLGFYGDPDHIAIGQFTAAAALAAADPSFVANPNEAAHRIAKLYYLAPDEDTLATWRAYFGRMRKLVDEVERRPAGWHHWAITTRIDAAAYWRQVWAAVCCHTSQLPQRECLESLPPEVHQRLWCMHTLYRALSTVNGGRAIEDDLFAGLR
jgi:LmbE family N-acetylglucosaminyl deacetylase